jgi:hypothetical protein
VAVSGVNIAIRGFIGGVMQFEERIAVSESGDELETLAEKHMRALAPAADGLHMIEFEFLDEPDPLQRFFRIGTDPAGMVAPIGIRLS